jgi:hypothetical protein
MKSATVDKNAKELNINVMDYKLGYYIVNIEDNSGISYKAKFIKQ